MSDINKYVDMDLYGLLGVEIGSTDSNIRKAYRKKALECHPDKNPDNPRAAELFHKLSKALEILSDEAARKAYDRVLNARKAAELRNKQLDSKRQKFKADLEIREKLALNKDRNSKGYCRDDTPEANLRAEIERLRKEGSQLLEQEQELLRQQLINERLNIINKAPIWNSSEHRIKIKWNATKTDETNGGYTEDLLRKFLRKYGDVNEFVMCKGKNGSALVEFKERESAEMAVAYEKGLMTNPLKLSWISDGQNSKNNPIISSATPGGGTITEQDYESLVLRQMRQAEERKKIIQQMQREDEENI